MSTFATSDLITYCVKFNAAITHSLKYECGLGVTEYRMLAALRDLPEGKRPTDLSRYLGASPGMISIASRKLFDAGLVFRESKSRVPACLKITKMGIDKLNDADVALAHTFDDFFAPLPDNLKLVISTGSTATNTSTGKGNRMRQGNFFYAFEVFHAFLVFEKLLTKATHSYGLSLTEFRVLFALCEEGANLSPSDFCRKLVLKPPLVTHAIGRLRNAGYVRCLPNKLDNRSMFVALTDSGKAVFNQAFIAVEDVFTIDMRQSVESERNANKEIAAHIVPHLKA